VKKAGDDAASRADVVAAMLGAGEV